DALPRLREARREIECEGRLPLTRARRGHRERQGPVLAVLREQKAGAEAAKLLSAGARRGVQHGDVPVIPTVRKIDRPQNGDVTGLDILNGSHPGIELLAKERPRNGEHDTAQQSDDEISLGLWGAGERGNLGLADGRDVDGGLALRVLRRQISRSIAEA